MAVGGQAVVGKAGPGRYGGGLVLSEGIKMGQGITYWGLNVGIMGEVRLTCVSVKEAKVAYDF